MAVSEKEFTEFKSEVRTEMSTLRTEVQTLKMNEAVGSERHTVVVGRLDKLDGHLTWLTRIMVAGIIGLFFTLITVYMKGGMNVAG